jgi:hypothetical protein
VAALSDVALKEWAVICHELAAGRQILLLRKGGIREPGPAFGVEHRGFFLFPTYFHENADDLAPPTLALLPAVAAAAPPAGELRLDLYASIERVWESPTLEPLRRLDGQHGLAWQAIERRFRYRRPGLHVLALRVHRLAVPIGLPNLSRYDGCHSWVRLESAMPTVDSRAVLDDDAFGRRLATVSAALADVRSVVT